MTVYVTPYDTTAGAGFVMNKQVAAIVEANIRTSFLEKNAQLAELGFKKATPQPTIVANRFQAEQDIPYFSHPLVVDMGQLVKHRVGEVYMVADMRPFLSSTQSDSALNVKNTTEFSVAKTRLVLSNWWAQGHLGDFKYLSILPLGVYASWISENCSRKFFLDPKDQLLFAVLAAIYYQSLFLPIGEWDENIRHRMVPAVSRATRASGDMVLDVLDQIDQLDSLQDFCTAVKKVLDNPRIDDLNPGTLITIVNTSWFGTNAKEISAVAVDHPPTFLSLIYAAYTQRTYTQSPLGRLTKPYAGNKGESEFLKGMRYLMDKAS